MANIIIREGTPADNEGLIDLTSITPMKGKIPTRIDRNPDFFRLLELRGSSFVIIAELNGKIIGSYSASASTVLVNGEPETAYYLADFKVHPDHRKSTVASRLGRAMLHKLESMDADLLFCSVTSGNEDVLPLFRGRALFPAADDAGTFRVLEILPTPVKTGSSNYQLDQVQAEGTITSFFNNFMKSYRFAPVYSENSFNNSTLIKASLDNETVAALALFDPGSAKQNVLTGLPFFLKSLLGLIRMVYFIYPVARLPKINEPMRILFIKSFAVKPGHERALKALIGMARNIASEQNYTFLSIGIHEKDPFLKIFSGYPKIIFKTIGFLYSLKDNKFKIREIQSGIPFEDFSLV
ncbi:MAG: GNAT family N-acetyltransferase [Bacteroidia bacterium]|nr:GNAT family N-acetyltransferase [Bacteroidia bacterium]